jgi:nucleoside-diphosphate-sugar epimerase
MRIFLTGATGFIGSAIIPELTNAGHQVLGLTRSEEGAKALQAAGVEVHHGSLEDVESLRSGAAKSDGVIHCAFNHDFSKFAENSELDRRAIEALGSALVGSNRKLIITSGTALGSTVPGQPASEDNFDPNHPIPRKSELGGLAVSERGVNVSVVRLPQVHDTRKQGLITYLIALAKDKGVSAYLGDGKNRWPAAHVSDTARLYKLVLEKGKPGARYNSVAEEGVSFREIAEAIGRGLKVPVVSKTPEQASEHFGWLGMFAGLDMTASSKLTRERLGWNPTGPTMIADLENMDYSKV